VAEFLFRRATTEGPQAVTATIFWLKTRAAAGARRRRTVASGSTTCGSYSTKSWSG
jgi:hypothetical protein